jgi:zinc protease
MYRLLLPSFSIFVWLWGPLWVLYPFVKPSRAGAASLQSTTDVQLSTLPNGLRVLIREQHTVPLVAIDIWVRAGSGQEAVAESGVAHFLEHLIFKGTPTRKPGEIDAAIEDLGALLNAGTTRDGTHFHTTVASRYLETALDVLADALQNATLSEEEMQREQIVILDEMARGRNDIQRRSLDRLHSLLFPQHAYGRPIHGLAESLSSLTQDKVSAFYRRFYAPNNTTVVLVGDFSPPQALASVRKAFGAWQQQAIPSPTSLPEVQGLLPRRVVETSPTHQGVIAIGFRVDTENNTQQICIADILSLLIKEKITERLSQGTGRTTFEPEVAIDYVPVRGSGLLAIYVAIEPSRLEMARHFIDGEIRHLQQELVDISLLEGAKRRAVGEYLFQVETYSGQARLLGLFDTIGDYRTALEYPKTMAKITPKAIQEFAKRYFHPLFQAEILLMPKEKP